MARATDVSEPRDLLEIASDVGGAQVALGAIYRALANAFEDEIDPIRVKALVLADLIASREALSRIIAELEAA